MDDIYTLDGPTFFSRAFRVGAYQGVIAARMAAEQAEDAEPGSSRSFSSLSGARNVETTREALAGDAELAGLFEFR